MLIFGIGSLQSAVHSPQSAVHSPQSAVFSRQRSVCLNIGKRYRKRLNETHFVIKISDSDMENTETQVWLDFVLACEYIP